MKATPCHTFKSGKKNVYENLQNSQKNTYLPSYRD